MMNTEEYVDTLVEEQELHSKNLKKHFLRRKTWIAL